jgi:peptidoglycan/LPS O-acetylase OafA/YrhL
MGDPLARSKSGYIPTLDGWRTVAVFCVMTYHSGAIMVGRYSLRPLQDLGRFGVHLFFAISGILICTRLVDEEERHGSMSLRSFYARRVFRIQPAAFVVLAVVGALSLAGAIPWNATGWWTSLLSVRNFYASPHLGDGSIYTNHFWSLAVEEHFYLVLPLLLVLLRGPGRQRWFALPTMLSVGWMFYLQHYSTVAWIYLRTDYVLCFLFVPAWLALLVRSPSVREAWRKWLLPGPIMLMALVGVAAFGLVLHVLLVKFLLVILPLMVFSTILRPESWVGRFLELAPLRMLGRISYSVYLWQQFFCRDAALLAPEHGWLGHLQHFPWNVVCSLGCGAMSYFLIEKPMIRLGHRLFPPVTPGHRDLEAVEGAPARV